MLQLNSFPINKIKKYLHNRLSNFPTHVQCGDSFNLLATAMGGSPGDVSENPVTYERRKKGWRMNCDVGEATESLENELCCDYTYELCPFSKLSVTSPASRLIFQPFPRFTYVTAHSPTLPLLHLHHSSFSNPSFASRTSQDFHLRHQASRPCESN